MKKFPIWIGIAVLLSIAFILKNKKNTNKTLKKILFVGDSITASQLYSYPALIKKLRPDLEIDILAKGGMTTKWMLDNLPSKINNNYDRIYIYGGINDAFNNSIPLSSTINNVQKMVDIIEQNGSDPYIIIGYQTIPFMDYKKIPTTRYVSNQLDYVPMIKKYGDMQNMFRQISNTSFVNKFDLGTSTSDGIHPSGTGQNIIANKIIETF